YRNRKYKYRNKNLPELSHKKPFLYVVSAATSSKGWTICKASILARFNIGVCVQTHISAPCRQTCFVLSLVSPGQTLLLGSLVSILSSLCDSVILYVCWRETCTFDLFEIDHYRQIVTQTVG